MLAQSVKEKPVMGAGVVFLLKSLWGPLPGLGSVH